jgi:hypothetical protein
MDALQNLQKWMNRLAEYCHNPECDNIEDCPEDHPNCQKRLGLNTAIAWIARDSLQRYHNRRFLGKLDFYGDLFKRHDTRDYLERSYLMISVLLQAVGLHRKTYPDLHEMLFDILKDLITKARSSGQIDYEDII